jgi:hypothetical protein
MTKTMTAKRTTASHPAWCEGPRGACSVFEDALEDRKHYGPELRIPLGNFDAIVVESRYLALAAATGRATVPAEVFADEPAFISAWIEQGSDDARPSLRIGYGETNQSTTLDADSPLVALLSAFAAL